MDCIHDKSRVGTYEWEMALYEKIFFEAALSKMLLREVHILGRALYSLRNFAIAIANH